MYKYLITGSSGFVSRHFIQYLAASEPEATVLGLDVISDNAGEEHYGDLSIEREQVNLLDGDKLSGVISEFKPDFILHLAAASSVAYSWQEPALSFKNNTNIFLSLLEAVRKAGLQARILSVGSSEVYGNVGKEMLPIVETAPLDPLSPYAIARVAQEMISKLYSQSFGMDIVMTRSFNHIGPGQSDRFVVSSFAKQIAGIKRKAVAEGSITAGDVSVVRDFLDVRDVVKAYHLLLLKGKQGEIYNVCSGQGTSIRGIIEQMASIAGVKVTIETNKELIRPNDNKVIIGSNAKIVNDLGWQPAITIGSSLKDIIESWEKTGGKK